MVIKTKVLSRVPGFHPFKFDTDPTATKYVKVLYRKRGRLGKWLKLKAVKKFSLPKNSRIKLIENNRPKVGQVFIKYEVKKKK